MLGVILGSSCSPVEKVTSAGPSMSSRRLVALVVCSLCCLWNMPGPTSCGHAGGLHAAALQTRLRTYRTRVPGGGAAGPTLEIPAEGLSPGMLQRTASLGGFLSGSRSPVFRRTGSGLSGDELRSRARGVLLGAAVGDALGAGYDAAFAAVGDGGSGCYTGVTERALGVASALIAEKGTVLASAIAAQTFDGAKNEVDVESLMARVPGEVRERSRGNAGVASLPALGLLAGVFLLPSSPSSSPVAGPSPITPYSGLPPVSGGTPISPAGPSFGFSFVPIQTPGTPGTPDSTGSSAKTRRESPFLPPATSPGQAMRSRRTDLVRWGTAATVLSARTSCGASSPAAPGDAGASPEAEHGSKTELTAHPEALDAGFIHVMAIAKLLQMRAPDIFSGSSSSPPPARNSGDSQIDSQIDAQMMGSDVVPTTWFMPFLKELHDLARTRAMREKLRNLRAGLKMVDRTARLGSPTAGPAGPDGGSAQRGPGHGAQFAITEATLVHAVGIVPRRDNSAAENWEIFGGLLGSSRGRDAVDAVACALCALAFHVLFLVL